MRELLLDPSYLLILACLRLEMVVNSLELDDESLLGASNGSDNDLMRADCECAQSLIGHLRAVWKDSPSSRVASSLALGEMLTIDGQS